MSGRPAGSLARMRVAAYQRVLAHRSVDTQAAQHANLFQIAVGVDCLPALGIQLLTPLQDGQADIRVKISDRRLQARLVLQPMTHNLPRENRRRRLPWLP